MAMRSPSSYDARSVPTATGRSAGTAPGTFPRPAAAAFELPAVAVPSAQSDELAPAVPGARDHDRRSPELSLRRGVSSTRRPPASCRRTDVSMSANQAVRWWKTRKAPAPIEVPSGISRVRLCRSDDDIDHPPTSTGSADGLCSSTHSMTTRRSSPGGLISASLITTGAGGCGSEESCACAAGSKFPASCPCGAAEAVAAVAAAGQHHASPPPPLAVASTEAAASATAAAATAAIPYARLDAAPLMPQAGRADILTRGLQ